MRIEWIEQYLREAEVMIVEGGQNREIGMAMLNDLLYEEPGYGSLHNHLGWAHLYYTLNQEQAEIHLKAAIRFQSELQATYLHLATLYARQGKYAEVIGILTIGLTKPQANRSVMLEMIGQSHEMRKEYTLAIKAYKEAMLASMNSGEMNVHSSNIKRCRKKILRSIF